MSKLFEKPILRETIRVAAPAMIESFFSALAGFIDSKMVSSLGTAAVASVAVTTQATLLRLTPFTAMNIALSALIARRRGENKRLEANKLFVTGLFISLLLGLVITVTFTLFSDPLMRFSGSNEDTHEMAVTYFRVIALGTIITVIQNCICAAHRGAGFTKIAMQTHLVSSGVNIVFNYLLIEGHFGFPRLEVFGAALATMIGVFAAAVMAIFSLFRKEGYLTIRFITANKIRAGMAEAKKIVKLGLSVFVEQILIRIGFMLNSLMAANLGTNMLAAHRVAGNFTTLSYSIGDGLSAAAVALVGRSLGESNPEKAKKYVNTCRLFGLIGTVLIATLFALFIRPLYGLFFTDQEVVNIGVSLTIPIILAVLSQILLVINVGALRGAGDVLFISIMQVCGILLFRPALSYTMAYVAGFQIIGIWIGTDADIFIRFLISSIRIAKGKWLQIKI